MVKRKPPRCQIQASAAAYPCQAAADGSPLRLRAGYIEGKAAGVQPYCPGPAPAANFVEWAW